MLVLDSDHLSVLGDPTPGGQALLVRLRAASAPVFTTVVSVEENLRGWLAQIHRATTPEREIIAYNRLQKRVEFFADWSVLSWDAESSALFRDLRRQGIRIGTHDLRIASIVLAHDATLLTRNARDFAQVPGLKMENWLD